MRQRFLRRTGFLTAASLAVCTLLASSTGIAQATEGVSDASEVAPSGVAAPGDVTEIYSEGGELVYTTEPQMSAFSLPAIDHAQCMVANNAKWRIRQYTAAYSGSFQGNVDLLCGTATAGYKHISARHSGDWVNRITWNGYLPAHTWDTFMITLTGVTLKGPSRVASQKDQKSCYEAPFRQIVKNSNGTIKAQRTFYNVVIVSQNNRVVITSFPPTAKYCK